MKHFCLCQLINNWRCKQWIALSISATWPVTVIMLDYIKMLPCCWHCTSSHRLGNITSVRNPHCRQLWFAVRMLMWMFFFQRCCSYLQYERYGVKRGGKLDEERKKGERLKESLIPVLTKSRTDIWEQRTVARSLFSLNLTNKNFSQRLSHRGSLNILLLCWGFHVCVNVFSEGGGGVRAEDSGAIQWKLVKQSILG